MSKRQHNEGVAIRLAATITRLVACSLLLAVFGSPLVISRRTEASGNSTAVSAPHGATPAVSSSAPIATIPVSPAAPNFPCPAFVGLQGVAQAPTNLVAAAASGSQVNLSWTPNGTGTAGFSLEREVQGGTFAVISTICAGINSYSDSSGLTADTTYVYRVRAFDSNMNFTAYSNTASATPGGSGGLEVGPPPAAPVLSDSVVSGTQINLSWTETGPVNGFFIERAAGSGGTFTQIAQTAGTATTYSDTSLSLGTTYFYRMRAFVNSSNSTDISSYSNEINATTFNVPAAPTSLAASAASSSQINLSWTESTSPVDGFTIQRETTTGGAFAQIASIAGTATSYSDTDPALQPQTSYTYRMQAFSNVTGFSGFSNTAAATTDASIAAPTSLAITSATGNEVQLSWDYSGTQEQSFDLERQVGANGTYVQIATLTPGTTTFGDTDIAPNTEYFYRIRALNSPLGNSAYSNVVNVTTPIPPAAPSDLTATANFTTIDLTWTNSATNADGVYVWRQVTSQGSFVLIATLASSATSYSDTGLQAGTTYYYEVQAFSASLGESAFSNQAGATAAPNPPPSITSISPTQGVLTGGTPVTITGTGFLTGATVTIGGAAATNINVASSTSITATTPAGALGAADVVVTNTDGQTSTLSGGFTYVNPAPTVSSVSPNSGPVAGGTSVTITGTGFLTAATVNFGSIPATGVTVVSSTSITATTQAESAGSVGVVVTNTDNQSGTLPNGYTFLNPAPTVTSISPTSGLTTGGLSVTITGTGFSTGATVTIGGAAATNVAIASSTSITATTPAHAAGAVNVVVTNTDTQTGTLPNGFTYTNPAPTVTSISPSSAGTGGGTVTAITGTGFLSGATVTFGGTAATGVTISSGTSISATTPPGAAGTVNVVVTNTDGQNGTLTNGFTYVNAPTVTVISPASGLTSGGTAVTITGTNFLSGATVTIGGSAATGVSVTSSTQITATTPAHAAGAVSVVVTNPGGQSGTLTNGFTYTNPAPTISSISPTSGSSVGGTVTTITGTGFLSGATVTFGGTAATSVTVSSGTSISATTPVESAATVNVVVTNTDGQSGTLTNGFTFVNAPTVTAISPSSGLTSGGTAVTITGAAFLSGATVTIGGTAATGVSVTSSTQITATTAAHAAGAVNVVVTNPGGQSGTLTSGFTYKNPAPTVSSISPAAGPIAGGTAVTITGTGFLSGATVSIGGVSATGVTVGSGTSITATTAANSSGTVNVVVTNTDGQSGTLSNGFQYQLLADPFTESTLNTNEWVKGLFTTTASSPPAVTLIANTLQIGPVTAASFDGLESKSTYNFTGAYCYIRLDEAFPEGSSELDQAVLTVGSSSKNWYSIEVTEGHVICQQMINGTESQLAAPAYSPTSIQFLRIRHDTGTGDVFFETAPNNGGVPGTWTTIFSEAWNSSVTLTSILFEIKGGTAGTPDQGTATFTNFVATKP